MSNKAWSDFCDDLKAAGAFLTDDLVPRDAFTEAEGIRYLIRLLRFGTVNFLENSDTSRPKVLDPFNPNMKCKIGADNPDNIYQRMNVAGTRRYRISGTRGTAPLMTFGSKANKLHIDGTFVSTGELDMVDVPVDEHGRFSFVVSKDRPESGAWLPISEETTNVLCRQSFQDRSNEKAAEFRIQVLDEPSRPAPLDPVAFAAQLRMATSFVSGTAEKFADWTKMFMKRPNEIIDWGQELFQDTGGDPTIFYLHGYWQLAPDEAWVIDSEVPDCEYWNFVLHNWWMESLDHERANTYINNHTAKLNADGTVTIVVSATDPGVGNWISTDFHNEETALIRWVKADHHPVPTSRVVKISDL
ncbi:DUF1214 domain-containing protein [Nocardioides sp. JQ2195]|uniref:DUF1214 domain-containing protein n=1 Tax=Nocardioides sp. JQ2195 TaxID=2592334 RepID=UPI00143E63E0|nr:DUF1214 domain-containing protein [Nocardioides sp. JQ2195]QIX26509.1 DUF1214 domain-containing protein [Nocardioides sp. JQ2195]